MLEKLGGVTQLPIEVLRKTIIEPLVYAFKRRKMGGKKRRADPNSM